jgi:hypothetical protein
VGLGREQVLLTVLTPENHLQVPQSWYNAGRLRRLGPGRYLWYVRPQKDAYGREGVLIGQGSFDVRTR